MAEKKSSYLRRFFVDEKIGALNEGAHEIGKDLSVILNKYSREDMPLVLACIKMSIPAVERICGEDGIEVANTLCGVKGCISWEGNL